ncbi:hypothetical protein ACFU3O_27165 [Streptomyces antibioticus]|uniref:hypothetical protein n=1 Tax=Streptomyces antibioticus TaxID=1890 RepID=UPI00369CA445
MPDRPFSMPAATDGWREWLEETGLAAFGPAQDALEKLVLGIAPEHIETAD